MAHAVIPHHHHTDEICLINHNTHSESDTHEHRDCDHQNEHQEDDNKCCTLEEDYLIPSNEVKYEERILDLGDGFNSSVSLQLLISDRVLNLTIEIDFSGSPPPLIASSYYFVSSKVHGLRAPPVV